ncbi:MAG: cell division protein FtsQ/DivIB [Nitrospinota bacterium]
MKRKSKISRLGPREKKGKTGPSLLLKGLLFAAVLAGGALGGVKGYDLALSSPFFSLKSVKISPMVLMKEEDVLKISGVLPGENLFSIQPEEVEQKLSDYPWIERGFVKRKLPSTVEIRVTERFPSAILVADKNYLVDREGFVLSLLPRLPELSIPVIKDKKKHGAVPGDKIKSKGLSAGMEVLAVASRVSLTQENEVSLVELAEDGRVRVVTTVSPVSLYFDRAAIDEGFIKLGYMKNVIQQKDVREVDFSFRNQAVVKKGSPVPGEKLALREKLHN